MKSKHTDATQVVNIGVQRPHSDDTQRVTVEVQIKETKRRFTTVRVSPQMTLYELKLAIIGKHSKIVAKSLRLTEDMCTPRILVIYKDGQMLTCRSQKQLKNLGMKAGRSYTLVASFARVYAFLTKSQLNQRVERLEAHTDEQMTREMRLMALTMADNATFEEARLLLSVSKAEVFEQIICCESRQAVLAVKTIRELPRYPLFRVRYQIRGREYKQVLI